MYHYRWYNDTVLTVFQDVVCVNLGVYAVASIEGCGNIVPDDVHDDVQCCGQIGRPWRVVDSIRALS